VYDIERYLNVRSAFGASFGPEGDRLCFRLNTTGTPQLWSLTSPRGWPDQHTFFEERVTFGSYSPERQEIIFGKDVGGNERTQFHRLDLTDGQIVDLTQHPDAKHRWRLESRRRAVRLHVEPPRGVGVRRVYTGP